MNSDVNAIDRIPETDYSEDGVDMTLIRSAYTPETVEVKEGDQITLKVTNVETNISQLVSSNEVGDYTVPYLNPGRYTLEVSSPGVERHLREPRDFIKRVGERVKVRASAPEEGGLTVVGEIAAADEDAVTIRTDGAERRVAYPFIRSARLIVIFAILSRTS